MGNDNRYDSHDRVTKCRVAAMFSVPCLTLVQCASIKYKEESGTPYSLPDVDLLS